MLPAEIIDFTFSFLQEDPATLKSCSAAHPLLSSLAERYLFVHIIVYIGSHPTPIDGFLVPQLARCLSEKPYLAEKIKSITIDASSSFYPFASSESFDEFSTLLPSITHSEELSLRSVRWPELSTKSRLALLDFLQTTHMKGFKLWQYSDNFPLTLLDDLKNIKNLKVDSSRCNFEDNIAQPIPTSLESLSLVDVVLHNHILWAGPRLSTLRSLHIKCHPSAHLSPILTACSGSLTSLTLEIGTAFQTTYRRGTRSSILGPLNGFPFTLSPLTSLELLTIHADISARSTDGTDETSCTNSCVSSVLAITHLAATAGPSLRRAVLNLDCTVRVLPDLRDTVEWGPLVLLCDLPIQPQVDLCIRASTLSHSQPSFVEVVDSLVGNEDVSKLVEQGSVVIKPLPHD